MRKLAVLGAALLLLFVGAGIAWASIPGPDGVIHGCRKNTDGSLRAIDSAATCPSGWTELNWSQTGPQGPAGGVSGYEVVTADRIWPGGGGSASGTLEAACPTGKKVLGGGWRSQQLDSPNLLIHWSYPDVSNNWWSVRYTVTDAGAAFTLTSYAVCATAS